jgi:hypothetical protein
LLFKYKGEFLPRFGYKQSEALYCQESTLSRAITWKIPILAEHRT